MEACPSSLAPAEPPAGRRTRAVEAAGDRALMKALITDLKKDLFILKKILPHNFLISFK
jgi:hypothetical protein